MAGKRKHSARAHRSGHQKMDFTAFERKAQFNKAQKIEKQSLAQMLKSAIRKTQNK